MATANIAHIPTEGKQARQSGLADIALILYRLREHLRDADTGLGVLENTMPMPDDDDADDMENVHWVADKISSDLSDCRGAVDQLSAALGVSAQGPDLLGDVARPASADRGFEDAWRALHQADSDCVAANEAATADRDQLQRLADLRQAAAQRLMALPARSASQLICKLWLALTDHADGTPKYFEASTLERLTSEVDRFSDVPQFTKVGA